MCQVCHVCELTCYIFTFEGTIFENQGQRGGMGPLMTKCVVPFRKSFSIVVSESPKLLIPRLNWFSVKCERW